MEILHFYANNFVLENARPPLRKLHKFYFYCEQTTVHYSKNIGKFEQGDLKSSMSLYLFHIYASPLALQRQYLAWLIHLLVLIF